MLRYRILSQFHIIIVVLHSHYTNMGISQLLLQGNKNRSKSFQKKMTFRLIDWIKNALIKMLRNYLLWFDIYVSNDK